MFDREKYLKEKEQLQKSLLQYLLVRPTKNYFQSIVIWNILKNLQIPEHLTRVQYYLVSIVFSVLSQTHDCVVHHVIGLIVSNWMCSCVLHTESQTYTYHVAHQNLFPFVWLIVTLLAIWKIIGCVKVRKFACVARTSSNMHTLYRTSKWFVMFSPHLKNW